MSLTEIVLNRLAVFLVASNTEINEIKTSLVILHS